MKRKLTWVAVLLAAVIVLAGCPGQPQQENGNNNNNNGNGEVDTRDISGDFTDPQFLAYIRRLISIPEGAFTRADVADIDILTVYGIYGERRLYNLEGIEHLVNLTMLDASFNNIRTVDLSNNTELRVIELTHNNLDYLDVSALPYLYWLNLYNNRGGLGAAGINLSNNPELETLSLSNIGLTSLDLTNNKALLQLQLEGNLLTSIDLTSQSNLYALYIPLNPLQKLDLSQNTELRFLSAYATHLTELDLSANINLEIVTVNATDLTKVTWPANPERLYSVSMTRNNLTSFSLTNAPNLVHVYIQNNEIEYLNLSDNISLTVVNAFNNRLSNTANVNFQGSDAVTSVQFGGNEFVNFNGAVLPPNVVHLWLTGNGLQTVDLSSNINLTGLLIYNNNLTELNLDANIHLQNVVARNNQITGNLVFNHPNLWRLKLENNNITSVDITNTSIGDVPEIPFAPAVINVTQNNITGLSGVIGWQERGLIPGFNLAFLPQRGAVPAIPNILTTYVPTATVGEYFSFFFESDSQIPHWWPWSPAQWPYQGVDVGLVLRRESGRLHGTPTIAGNWNFRVVVTNAVGSSARDFILNIVEPD